jgi:hypothetical protein
MPTMQIAWLFASASLLVGSLLVGLTILSRGQGTLSPALLTLMVVGLIAAPVIAGSAAFLLLPNAGSGGRVWRVILLGCATVLYIGWFLTGTGVSRLPPVITALPILVFALVLIGVADRSTRRGTAAYLASAFVSYVWLLIAWGIS